jgi:NADPH:quinone reductase-like Zn-dependent oxidoreductase
MKALVAERHGGPEVLALVDRPEPEVGPRDVLIADRRDDLNRHGAELPGARAGRASRVR